MQDESKVIPALIAAGSTLIFLLLHLAFLDRAQPDALYMDSLRLLHQLQEWSEGRLSFAEIWGVGSAHRGFINQLALLGNIRFFSLDVLLANRMTGVVTGLVAFILVYALNRQFAGTPTTIATRVMRLFLSLLVAGLCFSWAGFELFTLDLGFPLWTKNLCFVLFFVAHDRYLVHSRNGQRAPGMAVLLAVAGAGIVMFVGMGWSYAFAGAVFGVHFLASLEDGRRAGLRPVLQRALPVLAVFAALALSLTQGGGGGQGGDEDSFGRLLGALSTLLELPLYALGGAWIGVETRGDVGLPLAAVAGMGAISVLVAAYGLIQRMRRGVFAGSLLPLHLVAYGALTAVSLAAARGAEGPAAVMASRYYMDVVLFAVGTLWLLAEDVEARKAWRRTVFGLFMLYGVALSTGLYLTYMREWDVAPYRAANFEAMNRALYLGVPDEAAAQLLQSPLAHARQGAEILRKRRLALFATVGNDLCEAGSIRRLEGWNAPEGDTVWMTRQARLLLPSCRCALVAQLYLPADFPERTLHVEDAAGTRIEAALAPGRDTAVTLPAGEVAREVRLSLSQSTVPARDLAGGTDLRELGVLWRAMAFSCNATGSR